MVTHDLQYVTPSPIGKAPRWIIVPAGEVVESIPFNSMSAVDRQWMVGIARRHRRKNPNARFIGFEFDGVVRSAEIGGGVEPKRGPNEK